MFGISSSRTPTSFVLYASRGDQGNPKKLMKRLLSFVFVLVSVCFVSFGQNIVEHVVTRGETLQSIARLYGIQEDDITSLNPSAAKFLYVGQKLQIKTVPATPVVNTPTETPSNIVTTTVRVPEYQEKSEPVNQYIPFFRPKLKGRYELAMMDIPVGKLVKSYDGFNFGQHYCLGLSLYLTDKFYAATGVDYQWYLLNAKSTKYTKSIEVFQNFVGAPIVIGYGGAQSGSMFGLSAGFWLGGDVGGFMKQGSEKNRIKGGGFVWAPMVDLSISFVKIQYRAYFYKGTKEPIHSIGVAFSY